MKMIAIAESRKTSKPSILKYANRYSHYLLFY